MAPQATAASKKKEVSQPAFASITAADIIRAPVVERSVPLDLLPLLKPFKRAGRLTLRVERLPQRAKMSAGRRNNDGSWSLASDELSGLNYLVPSNVPAEHELTIRVMTFEDGSASTLKVIQYPIRMEVAPETPGNDDGICRSSETHDPVLRSQLGEMQSLFAVRESELVELRAAVQQAKSESAAELQKARTAWEQDLNQRLAEVIARAELDRIQDRNARQADSQQVIKAEARAEEKLAAERKRWQAETEQHVEAERQKWQAEAARTAAAERERWQAETKLQLEGERHRWQSETEQRIERERQIWQTESEQRTAGERDRWTTQTGQHIETERKRWQSEIEKRVENERRAWQAETEQRVEAERQKWRVEVEQQAAARGHLQSQSAQHFEAERQRWHFEMAQRIEAERLKWQVEADQQAVAVRGRWQAEAAQQFEAERQNWQTETVQRIEAERQKWQVEAEQQAAAARGRWQAEATQHMEAERQRWQVETAQRIENERQALGPQAEQRTAAERERWQAETKLQLEGERHRWQTETDRQIENERQAWQAQTDQRLDHERKRHESESLATLKRAEESWKADEAARAAAASAEWQQLSARILLEEKDKTSKLEVSLAVESDKCRKLEAALAHAMAQAKAVSAPGEDSRVLDGLRDDLAKAQAALDQREIELVRARAEQEQERNRWQQEAQAALEARTASLKSEEAQRLKVMADMRAQSEEALAQMTARCESAEQALTDVRSRKTTAHADDGYIESLRSEVQELRNALVKSETELGWARSALDQAQPLHIRRAAENLPIGMASLPQQQEEEPETAFGSKRGLVRDFLIVVAVAVPAILFYPLLAGYLPDGVRSNLATVTGGLLSAGDSRPAVTHAAIPAPAPAVQRPVVTLSRSVNVRATPALKGVVVLSVPRGGSLIVLEQSGAWTHVEIPAKDAAGKAQQGWVFSTNLIAKKDSAIGGTKADASPAPTAPQPAKSAALPAVEPAPTDHSQAAQPNPPAGSPPASNASASGAPAATQPESAPAEATPAQ